MANRNLRVRSHLMVNYSKWDTIEDEDEAVAVDRTIGGLAELPDAVDGALS